MILSSCEPEIQQKNPGNPFSSGTAKVDRFISIGGSFAAGVTDNEQFQSSQKGSVSAILAGQLAKVGSRNFKQALMYDELGLGNRLKLELVTNCRTEQELLQVPFGGTPDGRNSDPIGNLGPFNDLSVPGARIVDLDDQRYASDNPYFARMQSVSGVSILDDVNLINPSFFFLWGGEHDAYDYARNGAATSFTVNGLTSIATFRNQLETAVQRLVATGAKGVIANIPSISDLPFFRTVRHDLVVLSQSEADQLNLFYTTNPNVRFKAGRNPVVIQDGAFLRFIEENEYLFITLNKDSVRCSNYGTVNPLPDQEVLTSGEIGQIEFSIQQYNLAIRNIADKYGLALFDANLYFKNLREKGVSFDGIRYDTRYIEGGFISLDGIYPTQRGNAILVNELINRINGKFSARVPLCDISKYPTVAIP